MSDTIILTGSNAKFLTYFGSIKKPYTAKYKTDKGTLTYSPVQAFRDIPDQANAQNYFVNMYEYWQEIWK